MQVTIKKLGAVEKGTFELKPLTVFVGNNNTGKTWTAYATALMFSNELYSLFLKCYLTKKNRSYNYSF